MGMQIFINSGIFVYIMVRYAVELCTPGNRWKLLLLTLLIALINFYLMTYRFEAAEAAWRAINISIAFPAGAFFMYWVNKTFSKNSE